MEETLPGASFSVTVLNTRLSVSASSAATFPSWAEHTMLPISSTEAKTPFRPFAAVRRVLWLYSVLFIMQWSVNDYSQPGF